MTAERIDTRDAYDDEFALVKGEALVALEPRASKRGAVVGIEANTRLVAMSEDDAVQVASFLGNAVSPAACRDLLAELAPLACSDDLPDAVKAFLIDEAPPHLKRITAEGLTRGTVVRSLIEFGRALGRGEERAKVAAIMGAARKVAAAHASRLAALDAEPVDGDAYQLAIDARDTAIDDLAAELAKLEETGGAS